MALTLTGGGLAVLHGRDAAAAVDAAAAGVAGGLGSDGAPAAVAVPVGHRRSTRSTAHSTAAAVRHSTAEQLPVVSHHTCEELGGLAEKYRLILPSDHNATSIFSLKVFWK